MNRLAIIFKAIGLLSLTASLLLFVYNMWDEHRAGESVELTLETISKDSREMDIPVLDSTEELIENLDSKTSGEEVVPDYILNPEMEMPEQTALNQNYIGILEIPVLSLRLPVISDWNYPKLKIAPCRYSGSAYQDNLVLMAHNFSSHFGRINNLSYGDLIIFTDIDSNVFSYQVADIEILKPSQAEAMTEGEWALTLFTCTIGGQSRITIRCERI